MWGRFWSSRYARRRFPLLGVDTAAKFSPRLRMSGPEGLDDAEVLQRACCASPAQVLALLAEFESLPQVQAASPWALDRSVGLDEGTVDHAPGCPRAVVRRALVSGSRVGWVDERPVIMLVRATWDRQGEAGRWLLLREATGTRRRLLVVDPRGAMVTACGFCGEVGSCQRDPGLWARGGAPETLGWATAYDADQKPYCR